MSVKVNTISIEKMPPISDGKVHEFYGDGVIRVEAESNSIQFRLTFYFAKGFKCDGASVPLLFRWFLPSWADDDCKYDADVYNIGSCIHDGLYIHKGFGIFSREDCDDILRGIWRESGVGRTKAGIADKAIQLFAGGKRHWGNDSHKVGKFFTMEF